MDNQHTTFVDSRDFGAFIPAYLDDYGLDMKQFRVYSHIARRAGGGGKCWEGMNGIATVCCMDVKTVRKAIASLEALNLIKITETPGKTKTIELLPASEWMPKHSNSTPTKNGSPTKTGTTKSGRTTPTTFGRQRYSIEGSLNTKHSTDKTLNTEHKHDRVGRENAFSETCNFDSTGEVRENLEGTPEEETESSASLSKEQEPVARLRKSGEAKSSAAPRKVNSVRVAKQKRAVTLKNTVNDLGWLQMDKRARFKLARYVATQRMSILLAKLNGCLFGYNDAGDWYVRQDESEKWVPVADAFNADWLDIAFLRDSVVENGELTQEEFNSLLESIFEASVIWCDDQGQKARNEIDLVGIYSLFKDEDQGLLSEVFAA